MTNFVQDLTGKCIIKCQKRFNQEYRELSNQLSEYVVKLLDRVRTQDELELVLNKTGKPDEEKYNTLARLRLALQYGEKKFVSHPSCQQRLERSWFEGIGPFMKASILRRVLMVCAFLLAYPFLNFIFLLTPKTSVKFIRVLQFPWIKFTVHSASFVTFLALIVISTSEDTYILRQNNTLGSEYPSVFIKYELMKNITPSAYSYGHDLPIRQLIPTTTQLLITIWVLGFLYHECTQIYHEGVVSYCSTLYNIVDFSMLVTYTCSFGLKYIVMLKVHLSLSYLENTDIRDILANGNRTQYMLYWIMADRYFWNKFDPINLSEGLFAMANIISFSRISYLLPAYEALGPLQISLGRMLVDILKCLSLLSVVLVAFLIGLQNLYWYYNVRASIEVEDRNFEVPAQIYFGDIVRTFRTMFWSLFGRGEATVVTLGNYDNSVTEDIGYILYGLYNFLMVTVLLNMLIAMMARSFQAIAESSDVEWKFARSQLYMEYMTEEDVLPVPLNLLRMPRAIFEWLFDCCGTEPEDCPEVKDNFDNAAFSQDLPTYRNGVEHIQRTQSVSQLRSVSQIANQLMNERDSASSSVDLSAVDIYEANATQSDILNDRPRPNRRQRMQRDSIPGFLDGSKSYQRVMQRIIQRYIFDIQREAEVTEDDFEEIKQDISSFRYEMLNVMRSREVQFTEVQNQLTKLTAMLTGEPEKPSGVEKKVLANAREKLMMYKKRRAESFRSSKTPSEDTPGEDAAVGMGGGANDVFVEESEHAHDNEAFEKDEPK